MDAKEFIKKSKENNCNNFISYFDKQGFEIIKSNFELGVVSMEHKDGRSVDLFVAGTGIDFVIKGYNFGV